MSSRRKKFKHRKTKLLRFSTGMKPTVHISERDPISLRPMTKSKNPVRYRTPKLEPGDD